MWAISRAVLLGVCLTSHYLVGSASPVSGLGQVTDRASVIPRQPSLSAFATAENATTSDIEAARAIVNDAIAKMTKLNKARLENPRRNNFGLKPGTKISKRADNSPQLLEITDEIARAAALVAELEAEPVANATADPLAKRAGTFWMEGLAHKGSVPWGNDASYKVAIVHINA